MPEFQPIHLPGTRNAFLRGYLTCAEWTEELQWTSPEPQAWSAEFLERAEKDCTRFQEENTNLLTLAYERPEYGAESAGHDFWLTRNRHGAGFWDRRELETDNLGGKLTEAANGFGELSTYVGDDGLIYGG